MYESEREAAKERKRRKRRIQAQRRDRKKDFVPLQRATGGEQEEGEQEEGKQQEQQQQGASYAFVVNMHSARLVTPEKAEQAIGQEEKEEPAASSPKPDRKVKRSRSQMESSEPTQPKLMQSLSWGGDEDSSDEEVDLEEARRQARQWSEGVQA